LAVLGRSEAVDGAGERVELGEQGDERSALTVRWGAGHGQGAGGGAQVPAEWAVADVPGARSGGSQVVLGGVGDRASGLALKAAGGGEEQVGAGVSEPVRLGPPLAVGAGCCLLEPLAAGGGGDGGLLPGLGARGAAGAAGVRSRVPALSESGQREVGRQLAAAEPHQLRLPVRLAGWEGDGITGDLPGVLRAVAQPDEYVGGGEPVEEVGQAVAGRRGDGDAVAEHVAVGPDADGGLLPGPLPAPSKVGARVLPGGPVRLARVLPAAAVVPAARVLLSVLACVAVPAWVVAWWLVPSMVPVGVSPYWASTVWLAVRLLA